MSRKRKPQTARRERQATLTQRQRHRLNDIRPPVRMVIPTRPQSRY